MYYNRDLSWLEYNHRILREAACDRVPLYERIKFLSIFSSNFDEFFSIRYPVILAISNFKVKTQRKIEYELPDHFLEDIQKEVERQFAEFGGILTKQIIPALAANGITLYYNERLRDMHVAEVHEIFLTKVLSFLQPIFLDSDIQRRFKPEANRLYLVIRLRKHAEDIIHHAVIKIPSDHLPRFYTLSAFDGQQFVIFIDDIIRENCQHIFPGFDIDGIFSIKFNRNQDLDYSEDYRGNILKLIKKQLAKRALGIPSRFLHESTMPRNVQLYVASVFGVDQEEIFSGGRYHNLSDLSSLPSFGKQLVYDDMKPLSNLDISKQDDIFQEVDKRDILMHFPYHSYNPIFSFFNQAAIDPGVTEIYITLYRVAADSLIANALISAAKNGKKVTVFIELKARFDEANNIEWGRRMKKAGVKLIYSIPGIKVHTKIALVVRENRKGGNNYAVISTGNFNEFTAKFYADHTLLTVDEVVNSELQLLFLFLEKRKKPPGNNVLLFDKLLVSQFNMTERFGHLIKNEIDNVKKTGSGLIRIKLNNLEEPGMIDMLYNASKQGVTILLIVRSICCLIPGVIGLSEQIQVKRIVDRYLEHTRIFIFGTNDNAKVIIGSSDWMTRNLYHRIEVCTPVDDAVCRKELLDYFDLQWNDSDNTACADATDDNDTAAKVGNAQLAIYNYLRNKQ
jgi:polyphosphate kinase